MKKALVLTVILVAAVAFVFIGSSMAVAPGKTVKFNGGKLGPVVFDGKVHADKGVQCTECHPNLFQMKTGTVKITQEDHNTGKFCFTCHNGERAFKAAPNCNKCHQKKAIKGC